MGVSDLSIQLAALGGSKLLWRCRLGLGVLWGSGARGELSDAWFVGAAMMSVRGVYFHYTDALLKFLMGDLIAVWRRTYVYDACSSGGQELATGALTRSRPKQGNRAMFELTFLDSERFDTIMLKTNADT